LEFLTFTAGGTVVNANVTGFYGAGAPITGIDTAAKAKAGARGKATAARTKPKSTASKVVGALDKVGDFAIKALTKQPRTKQMYRQVGKGDPLNKLKDIKKAKK
jgi:hypothetical protein